MTRTAPVHLALVAGLAAVAAVGPAAAEAGWELLWSDEFDGERLDDGNWTVEVMADPHNEELQYYPGRVDDEPGSNVWVENGVLVIEARREDYAHRLYTSGRIHTKGKREFRYGRFEARLLQPAETGMWPAFWLLGANIDEVGWPACGEIDVMEGKGRLPNWTSGAIHRGPSPEENRITVGEYTLPSGTFTDWHRFAVEWEPGHIRWSVDDVPFHSASRTPGEPWPFDDGHPFFVVLNLAVGGWFDPGHPPPADLRPQRFLVDYVRVYRRSGGAPGSPAAERESATMDATPSDPPGGTGSLLPSGAEGPSSRAAGRGR